MARFAFAFGLLVLVPSCCFGGELVSRLRMFGWPYAFVCFFCFFFFFIIIIFFFNGRRETARWISSLVGFTFAFMGPSYVCICGGGGAEFMHKWEAPAMSFGLRRLLAGSGFVSLLFASMIPTQLKVSRGGAPFQNRYILNTG